MNTNTTTTNSTGGQATKAGFYWNKKSWEMVVLSGEGGVLPGDSGQRFVKVPMLAMLAAAPIMGGLFVVFLPVLGFALVFQHLGKEAAQKAGNLATDMAGTMGMQWRPGESWFAGRRGKKNEKPVEPKSDAPNADQKNEDTK